MSEEPPRSYPQEPRSTPEQESEKGIPRVPATPRDVIHILIGAFLLVLCFGVALTGALTRVWWVLAAAGVLAAIVAVDIFFALRRQRRLGVGPRSRG
ncbi:hypothetical protein [Microtetraspora fusca]|uniref:DUF2530 domain-containing protein n=1 Tax=Microtetraspora fusca TaxID=1997 RepID=A0ABW6V956_MICFU|nr:hypothetical protein [Microtetraspora fusca]